MAFLRQNRTWLLLLICFCLFGTTLTLAESEAKEGPWSELQRPGEPKGLFMEPALTSQGSRIHMVWSGTNSQIRSPEMFHTSISDGDKEWKSPRAPFFGKNKGRVRKLAIGKTRHLLGVVFQRTLAQSNEAYEVLLSISSDHGWSWSNTIEIDSYGSDKSGGTVVAVEGREGLNRPEFALAWAREYGNIRAANFDIKSSLRPEGTLIGEHVSSAEKIEIGALGKEGFSVLFNGGSALSAAHVRALVGKIEEAEPVIRGRFGNTFAVGSRPYGPSRLAVISRDKLETLTSDLTEWKRDKDEPTTLPFHGDDIVVKADIDGKQNLHLAMVRPVSGGFELWYIGQNKHVWQEPELIHTFGDRVDMRGFDIAATDRQLVVVASQGFDVKFFRRKI